MTDEVRVRAKLRLLSTSEGGRKTALQGGLGSYRPNHNFFGPDNLNMLMGFMSLEAGQTLEPGDSAIVEIAFLNWRSLEPELYPGREWLIQEGAQVVGVGTVMDVLTP
jgi:elongation factor Tu